MAAVNGEYVGFGQLDPPGADPVISGFSPDEGSPVSKTTPISFDVTDSDSDLLLVILLVSFNGSTTQEVVHDGTVFNSMYLGASNARSVISGGYHYTILRDGGWPGTVTLTPYAIDAKGNENA